jgi:hypothetical protein
LAISTDQIGAYLLAVYQVLFAVAELIEPGDLGEARTGKDKYEHSDEP